jgi:hypothetical protein
MEELRIFKREFDGQNPDLISGRDLLNLAIQEAKSSEDADGEIESIDDAFEYYDAFESIQECDLVGELSLLQQHNTTMRKALEEIKRLINPNTDHETHDAWELSIEKCYKTATTALQEVNKCL